jgi:hypothetical protein
MNRRESASDESLSHGVTLVSHQRSVSPHSVRVILDMSRYCLPPIVPVVRESENSGFSESSTRRRLPHVPQLDSLILAVADEVPAILPAVDVGDAIKMTTKESYRFRSPRGV